MGVIWVEGSALLCSFTRNTVMVAVALVPIVLLLAIFRKQPQLLIWGLLGAFVLAGLFVSFAWGDAALWGRDDILQSSATRSSLDFAPLGDQVFRLESQSVENTGGESGIFQIIHLPPGRKLTDKTVTVGAWIWADKQISSPNTKIIHV